MFGQFYECDHCHTRLYAERPDPGWIGMNRVLGVDSDHEANMTTVRVDEQHACSDACAHRLLLAESPTAEPSGLVH